MDFHIVDVLAILMSFSLLMLVGVKMGRDLKNRGSTLNIPPGPWKLPIIGHIHHLVTRTPPHRKLADMAKIYGPLMHLQLGEIFAIVVTSPKYAEEIMKTHDVIFASRPKLMAIDILTYGGTNIGFAPYGNYWRQLRKLCTIELLTQKRVNSFQPIREQEFNNLIKLVGSKEGLPINITEAIISSMFSVISKAACGNKCNIAEQFTEIIKGESVAGGFEICELFPSAKWLQSVTGLRPKVERLHKKIDDILESIMIEHKEAKSQRKEGQGEQVVEDLVDVLLNFQDGTNSDINIRLTDNNVKAIILDILGAGGETSGSTTNWAMAEMIKNPRVMKIAQDEVREIFNMKGISEKYLCDLNYLKLVLKETLRLHPPSPLLVPRECGEACKIDGYDIPVKSKVIVNAWALGRDPDYWVDPEKFYPERFIDRSYDYKGTNFEFIPFGAGRRICAGITLGLTNVEMALALLLFHFDWSLPNGMKNEDLDMSEQFGIVVKRKDDLYLIATTPPPSVVG